MLNRILVALATVVFVTGTVLADVKGTVTAKDKDSITVKTEEGKEIKLKLTKDTTFEGPKGKIDLEKVQLNRKVTIKTVKDQDDTAEAVTLEKGGAAGARPGIKINPANIKKIPNVQIQPAQPGNAQPRKVKPADKDDSQ